MDPFQINFMRCFEMVGRLLHLILYVTSEEEIVQHFGKYAHSLSCRELDEKNDTTLMPAR